VNETVEYFKNIYGYTLEAWQIKATEYFLYDKRDIIIKVRRGGRKSTWMDLMCLHSAVTVPNTFAIITSIGEDQGKEHIKQIRRFLEQSPFTNMVVSPDTETEINFNNKSRILTIPQSASTRKGYHPTIKFVDELAAMDKSFYYEVVMPMGQTLRPPARTIICSTPKLTDNAFKDLWFGRGNFIRIDVKTEDLPWISKEVLEQERDRMPEALFRQECLGEFVPDIDMPFKPDVIDFTFKNTPVPKDHEIIIGIDLARKRDYTAIAVAQKFGDFYHIPKIYRFQLHWDETVDTITQVCNEWKPVSVHIDATGVGDPITEELTEKLPYPIAPVVFTDRVKTNLITHLTLLMEKGRLTVDPASKYPLYDELINFKYRNNTYHDDTVMALALAVNEEGRFNLVPLQLKDVDKFI